MKRFKYLTLAALVAVAACDEGVDPVVTPVTGTVTGVVTIEAVAAVGVTVTLSNGSVTTTDGAGLFTFTGVPTGSYTVTISGFASDATFTATFKAAAIASSGEVATANFDGFVRSHLGHQRFGVRGRHPPPKRGRCDRRYVFRWNGHGRVRSVLVQRSSGRELHGRDD